MKERGARATRLPADFKVSDEWLKEAEEARTQANLPAANLAAEAVKFANYFISAPGAKGRKLDWKRTWINWALGAHAPAQTAAQRTLAAAIEGGLIPQRPDPEMKLRTFLKSYQPGGFWPRDILQTYPPDHPDTTVPLALLVEFGFRQAA